jgi:hypothetical protein
MDHLTSAWLEMATDVYLDHRHRNWLLAEEVGDVVFVAARGVVLVHRDRAEHIARALGWRPEVMVPERTMALPAMTTTRAPAPGITTAAKLPLVVVTTISRWRSACGWLGILARGGGVRDGAGGAARRDGTRDAAAAPHGGRARVIGRP